MSAIPSSIRSSVSNRGSFSLLTSSSLRGVPSGFDVSVVMPPRKPTTLAIREASSKIVISVPQPTLTWLSPE